MTVKIITDSTADVPPAIAKKLGIVVIPQYLIFGSECYKDRVDITDDEFYDRLVNDSIQPTTSQPSPQEFVSLYNETGKNADGIVSIHISSKMSGTSQSAEQASKLTEAGCPIEVIDSQQVAIMLGMVTIAAAKMAKEDKTVEEITAAAREMLNHVHPLVLFDTLEYLARGGRIGRAKALVGALLNVKPLLTIKDGEFAPAAQVRSRAKGKEKLLEFIKGFKDIEELYVVYSSDKNEAVEFSKTIKDFPQKNIQFSRLGPVVGSHTGPGLLAVVVRTKS
jgi:DegV family protein with EDD domain